MDLKLNSSNDLVFPLEFASGMDAIAQHIGIRLRTFSGEWFIDTRVGLPYFQRILIKNPDLTDVRNIFIDAILSTPDVISVDNMQLELNEASRTLSVVAEIRAVGSDDAVTINTEVIIP